MSKVQDYASLAFLILKLLQSPPSDAHASLAPGFSPAKSGPDRVIRRNDFDLLTSNDLNLGSRSLEI